MRALRAISPGCRIFINISINDYQGRETMAAVSEKRFIVSALIIILSAALVTVTVAETGQAQQSNSFSVLALNSIHMKSKAAVNSGDIGVMNQGTGPYLHGNSEITLESGVYLADGTALYGDTVIIKNKASVYDLHYNELDTKGIVRGSKNTPLALPLDILLSAFPTPVPGTRKIKVPNNSQLTLEPGSYGKVSVGSKATLAMAGGIYHIVSLDIGSKGKLLFHGSSDIVLQGSIKTGSKSVAGPAPGKTLTVRTFSRILNLVYSRIQFTPDLMPADILGTNIVNQDEKGRRYFEFYKGPVFGQVILADEINRASPKTQSALLEAMQEEKVTLFGNEYLLEPPFIVLATQNPLEMEGTYPLPEAQIDRFFFGRFLRAGIMFHVKISGQWQDLRCGIGLS